MESPDLSRGDVSGGENAITGGENVSQFILAMRRKAEEYHIYQASRRTVENLAKRYSVHIREMLEVWSNLGCTEYTFVFDVSDFRTESIDDKVKLEQILDTIIRNDPDFKGLKYKILPRMIDNPEIRVTFTW